MRQYSPSYMSKNVVASDHSQLWQPRATNSLSGTYEMVWYLTIKNCNGLWPQSNFYENKLGESDHTRYTVYLGLV